MCEMRDAYSVVRLNEGVVDGNDVDIVMLDAGFDQLKASITV